MREYVRNKLWLGIEPRQPLDLWILTEVFRIDERLISEMRQWVSMREVVYFLQTSLDVLEGDDPANKYLNAWNSARSDLVADLVTPPPTMDELTLNSVNPLPLGPQDIEPALWMLVYLYGFKDREISVMCPEYRWDPLSVRALMPLLKCINRRLQEMPIIREDFQAKDEHQQLLFHYHRTKYLLLRYYLDAVYHELNR